MMTARDIVGSTGRAEVCFKPGPIGLVCHGNRVFEDPAVGSQAHILGVREGWKLLQINGTVVPDDHHARAPSPPLPPTLAPNSPTTRPYICLPSVLQMVQAIAQIIRSERQRGASITICFDTQPRPEIRHTPPEILGSQACPSSRGRMFCRSALWRRVCSGSSLLNLRTLTHLCV